MNKKILGVTHSGIFHGDEVMATVILQGIYDEIEIIRTRDPEIIENGDIVYDVGGGEFDHHMDDKEYRDNGVPYSSCGLIWRNYGYDYIKKLSTHLSENQLAIVYESIDRSIIESIDAIDNGHFMEKNEIHLPTIDQLVKGFNPNWNTDKDPDIQFMKAVDFCRPILQNAVCDVISALEAELIIKESYDKRELENIMILDKFCPWKRHLEQYDADGDVYYVIFKDAVNGYRVQAVPELDSRESKKPFPKEWAGKEAHIINDLLDIDDAIFVHPARFIAGTGSLESAVKMAELALIY